MSEIYFIPVFTYSTNLLDFLYNIKVITHGSEMRNECRTVIPQFIPPFRMMPKDAFIMDIGINHVTPESNPRLFNPGGMNHYYSYYGEKLCTKEEFEAWAKEQPVLKKH